ncbi:thioredoxin-like protein [Butyriboletus roseoflavus]|nr:thioredoxin-like protein [Butyriboletus roseoflavus]
MPSLRLGNIAPDFHAQTTTGPISFHEWIGDSWAILFSHPGDFTPVCTTELGEVARRADDFAKRNVKVIGISANSLEDHHKWVDDINEFGSKIGPTAVRFPIIADADRKISTLYDMLDEQDATNRDNKGLPFTASVIVLLAQSLPYCPTDPDRLCHRSQESYPPDDLLSRFHGQEL